MHILACTTFAIASNCAILFDWYKTATVPHVHGKEIITQSNFWDLFSPHPMISLSYSMAVKQYGDVLTSENTSGEPKWSRWYWPLLEGGPRRPR